MQGYLFISFPAYFLVNFYEHIIHFYQTTIDKISIVTYQTKRKKEETKLKLEVRFLFLCNKIIIN